MFTFWSKSFPGSRRPYGQGENSYVSVVEFGSRVRGQSLHPFGSQTGPEHGERSDVQARYLSGDHKPAWLTLAEVRAHALESKRLPCSGQ